MTDEDFTALVRVVEDLQRERDEDRALVEELHIAIAGGLRGVPTSHVYTDWTTWVDQWLTTRISRNPKRYRWCHHYAEHPEAADRLEALWHAWEAQWPDPLARLSWFRDGLDHQLGVITADDGPLRECSELEGEHVTAACLISRSSQSSLDR